MILLIGNITVNNNHGLDYFKQALYTLQIDVSDGSLTTTQFFNISINITHDPPMFNNVPTTIYVTEIITTGWIFSVNYSDPEYENMTIAFSVVGSGSTYSFVLDSSGKKFLLYLILKLMFPHLP